MTFTQMVMPEDGGTDSKMNCIKCIFFNPDALGCMITDFQRKNIKVDGKKPPCMLNKSDNNSLGMFEQPKITNSESLFKSSKVRDVKIESDIKYEIFKEYYV